MNFYTLACKLNRQIKKDAAEKHLQHMHAKLEKSYESCEEEARNHAIRQFKENASLGIELMIEFKQLALEKGLYTEKIKQTFFITIRPNEKDITFDDFKTLVGKFIERKCFSTFELVFEQKATEPPYGHGFHCHILAQMTQRSKGDVLRCTQSTFKNCASANCIQVDCVKKPEDIERIRGYILEWQSDDDHKSATKDADIAWRQELGLLPVYSDARQLSSPVLAGSENLSIERGPIIIEMD